MSVHWAVEMRWFVAGILLVMIGAIAGQQIDQSWQPYGPNTIIAWSRILTLVGGILVILSVGAADAETRRSRERSRDRAP